MTPLIPWYAAPIVLFTSLGALAVVAALFQGRVRWGVAGALGIWFVLAWLAAPHAPGADPNAIPLSLPFFAAAPILVVLIALATWKEFRHGLNVISAPTLISIQIYRNIGVLFLALYYIGSLPRHFALPAGYGDIFVGLTAPLVALAVSRGIRGARPLAIGWNIVGLLDLFVAVGLGTGILAPLFAPGLGAHVPPARAMTFFPLVLIPTFAVPLAVLLHLGALRAVLRKREKREEDLGLR